MTPNTVHKTGIYAHKAYCGSALGRDEAATHRWSGVNCPNCRRAILDSLEAMCPGPEKDALVEELLGLNWAPPEKQEAK